MKYSFKVDALLFRDELWDLELDYSADNSDSYSSSGGFSESDYESTKICVFYKGKSLLMLNTVRLQDLAKCTFLDLAP